MLHDGAAVTASAVRSVVGWGLRAPLSRSRLMRGFRLLKPLKKPREAERKSERNGELPAVERWLEGSWVAFHPSLPHIGYSTEKISSCTCS